MLARRLLALLLVATTAIACSEGSTNLGSVVERSISTTTPTTTTTTATPTTTTTPATPPVALAASAAEMAERLITAEGSARSADADPQDVAAAGFEAQILYRQLARTPDWHDPVFDAVGDLRITVETNVAARLEFRSMHSTLSNTLPAWRIVEPAPADDLLAFYAEGEATFGVPWQILAAINLVETGMGRIRGTSVAGAQGPMQFMPATWDAYGEGDIDNPRDAILSAARYLAANGGGSGDIDNALFRYNNSNRYVRGVKHYASILAADARAFYLFYNWNVVYLSTLGDVRLPVGYEQTERIPVADYVAAHPEDHMGSATN